VLLRPTSSPETRLAAERRLQVLGVLEVRDKGGPHLDQESLQFRVLCARNQRLVYRVEHGLVIRHFVVDVRLVERRAAESLQFLEIRVAAALQALARRIVFRGHLQFRDQFRCRLVDAGVIRDHQVGKLLDLAIRGLGLGKLACVNVDLIGSNDDRRDLRVGDPLRRGAGGRREQQTRDDNS
jgi:hypothetical protein